MGRFALAQRLWRRFSRHEIAKQLYRVGAKRASDRDGGAAEDRALSQCANSQRWA
jgi:hypothetical protein